MSTADYEPTLASVPFSKTVDEQTLQPFATIAPVRFGAMTYRRPNPEIVKSSTIMIVDDEAINIKVVRKYLQEEDYQNFITTTEPREVRSMLRHENPDLIILDIMMPIVSGLEILADMYGQDHLYHIPVLILTAASDSDTKITALELGATDFLPKPVDPSELKIRVRNTLLVKAQQDQLANYSAQLEYEVRIRTAELAASRREAIHCLARAAEYRDEQTGHHVIRVGRYAAIVARELKFSEDEVALIEQAAQLHDVGKIGVPDTILRKAGKLDVDESEVMRRHCGVGQKILQDMPDSDWNAFRRHTDMGAGILEVG